MSSTRYQEVYIYIYIYNTVSYIEYSTVFQQLQPLPGRCLPIQDSAPEVFDEGAANAKNLGKPGLSAHAKDA